MIASFSWLNAEEVSTLAPDLTVFLFPIGGLEQHGPHLPIGTKLFQADELAQNLAKNLQEKMPVWNFILMPVLPLAIDTVTTKLSLNVRPHVLRDAIVDQCGSLKRLGFKQFAVVSSHTTPRQLSAIEDAGRIVQKKKWIWFGERSTLVSVTSARIQSGDIWNSPMISVPTEHGGADDTASVLRAYPNLVSKTYQQLPDLPKSDPSITRFMAYFQNRIDGYWGRPKDASPELTAQKMNREVEELALKLKPVFEQGKGDSFFNSGYRYFPLNGSFFKAYFLASVFFLIMLVWVMWSVKDVFDAS